MLSAYPVRLNHALRRICGRFLPLVLILGLSAPAANAQEEQAMPPSVVLVLKLISATHVEPVTGVVVAGEGLVLVPADFVSTPGEIIVLDGGADIIKHGRPARIVDPTGPNRLAVLSVGGLSRAGITLSGNALDADAALQLTAFPPAEDIARGAPPVRVPVDIENVGPASIPYVSGPILDSCGYLAGVSLTTGPQSLQPGKDPSIVFGEELAQMLETLRVQLPTAVCDHRATRAAPVAGAAPPEEVTQGESEPGLATVDGEEQNLVRPEVYQPFIPKKRLNPFQGTLKPRAPVNAEKPSVWRSIPPWLLLLGLVSLAVLVWKGTMFWRLHRKALPVTADEGPITSGHGPAVDRVAAEHDHATTGKPRSMPMEGTEFPDMDALPHGCNALVVVDGLIDTDMRFQRFCAVDATDIDITLGRNDADINISHPVISRSHARLENLGELMTLSDLGSDSGTFVSGVPCLPGEIMVVEPGDEIFLGDVRIRFSIIHKDADPS